MEQSLLSDKGAWKSVARSAKSCVMMEDGTIKATLPGTEGWCMVELSREAGKTGAGAYRPKSVEFREEDGRILRRVSVLEYFDTPLLGDVAKSLKVEVINKDDRLKPASADVTWTFNITRLEINPAIADDVLVFDPASVESISDEETGQVINVPK